MVAEAGGQTARSAPSQALWPLRSFVLMVEDICLMEQVPIYLLNTVLCNLLSGTLENLTFCIVKHRLTHTQMGICMLTFVCAVGTD